MKIDDTDLEECTFMDEEFFGIAGTYNPADENIQLDLPLPELTVDEETLYLRNLDGRIKKLESRINKIEAYLTWENIN